MGEADQPAPAHDPAPEPTTWWPVLVGCGGLLVLAAVALFTFAFFVGHKAGP